MDLNLNQLSLIGGLIIILHLILLAQILGYLISFSRMIPAWVAPEIFRRLVVAGKVIPQLV